VKNFNAALIKRGLALTTDQLAETLSKFIRGQEIGDLWVVLKRNASAANSDQKQGGKDSLMSTTEKLFFEFIYEINQQEEGEERWPGVFAALTR
jgi:1,2-phenylacetyl-CoA epoxidase PaaB subunit